MIFYKLFQKKRFLLSLIIGVALESATSQSGSDLNVLVTIKPIHSLVARVMGDIGDPKLLVRGRASPHTYALNASDAKALNSAKIVFRVSDEIEPFLKKTLESLPDTTTIVTLLNTPGLTLWKLRKEGLFQASSDKSSNKTLYYQNSQSPQDLSKKRLTSLDGHIWLNPQNAIILLREINRILKDFLPSQATTLDRNTDEAISEIQKTSTQIKELLKPLRAKPYLVFHDALQYYENYFHFPSSGSITMSSDLQPSGKHIARIRSMISIYKDLCLFTEPNSNSKILEAVLEGNKVQIGILDPEGLLVNPGRLAYTEILKSITYGLQSCLQ